MVFPNCIECIEKECLKNSEIRRIIIPKSVKTIEDKAFNECYNLNSVTLQEGLESIGEDCFTYT